MNYNFDIVLWFKLILSPILKKVNRLKWMNAIGVSFQAIFDDFNSFRAEMDFKTKYSSEQLSLQTLLNKLFDPTLERIRIETTSDIKPVYYQYNSAEPAPYKYSSFSSEVTSADVTYFASELLDSAASFEVRIPAAIDTLANRSKIASWVNYYRLHSRTFIIKKI